VAVAKRARRTSIGVDVAEFRRLCLSMPHAFESAHMGHPDFRAGSPGDRDGKSRSRERTGRIFATLYRQESGLAMVKLTPAQQREFVAAHPDGFAPITGGWGRQGATEVRLKRVNESMLREAIRTAWRNVAPKALQDELIFRESPRTSKSASTPSGKPMFFPTPADFRAWLERNHQTCKELVVGFWRKDTGKPSITWPQSVAEALCFGWIDGIRRSHSAEAYTIRFTPRRKGSRWSAINIRLIEELEAAGRMTDAGRKAFDARPHALGYSYERREATLDRALISKFKKYSGGAAWRFHSAQPPGYRKLTAWWVMSAKQAETRERRLAKLMDFSARGKRIT
jgi:uncharacterized protein YdeI (YjbR/CyaY-like superfamily)